MKLFILALLALSTEPALASEPTSEPVSTAAATPLLNLKPPVTLEEMGADWCGGRHGVLRDADGQRLGFRWSCVQVYRTGDEPWRPKAISIGVADDSLATTLGVCSAHEARFIQLLRASAEPLIDARTDEEIEAAYRRWGGLYEPQRRAVMALKLVRGLERQRARAPSENAQPD